MALLFFFLPPPLPLVGFALYFLLISVSVPVYVFMNQRPKDEPSMLESYIFLNEYLHVIKYFSQGHQSLL